MHILMHSGIPLLVPPLWTSICLYATLLTQKKCPELPDFVLIFAKIFWGRTPKPPFNTTKSGYVLSTKFCIKTCILP